MSPRTVHQRLLQHNLVMDSNETETRPVSCVLFFISGREALTRPGFSFFFFFFLTRGRDVLTRPAFFFSRIWLRLSVNQ